MLKNVQGLRVALTVYDLMFNVWDTKFSNPVTLDRPDGLLLIYTSATRSDWSQW